MRARWKDCPITKLKSGESFIGDFRECGLHSEMSYRHAKKVLLDCQIATFRGTNKGTVATLVNSTIFSISHQASNDQETSQATDAQQASNDQGTTNHKDTQNRQKTPSTKKTKGKGSLDELKAFCVEIGLPESDGDAQYHAWEGNGWVVSGKPIKDWKAMIRSWKSRGYMASQKTNPLPGTPNTAGVTMLPWERPGYRNKFAGTHEDIDLPL
jgi:hypothetical protein